MSLPTNFHATVADIEVSLESACASLLTVAMVQARQPAPIPALSSAQAQLTSAVASMRQALGDLRTAAGQCSSPAAFGLVLPRTPRI